MATRSSEIYIPKWRKFLAYTLLLLVILVAVLALGTGLYFSWRNLPTPAKNSKPSEDSPKKPPTESPPSSQPAQNSDEMMKKHEDLQNESSHWWKSLQEELSKQTQELSKLEEVRKSLREILQHLRIKDKDIKPLTEGPTVEVPPSRTSQVILIWFVHTEELREVDYHDLWKQFAKDLEAQQGLGHYRVICYAQEMDTVKLTYDSKDSVSEPCQTPASQASTFIDWKTLSDKIEQDRSKQPVARVFIIAPLPSILQRESQSSDIRVPINLVIRVPINLVLIANKTITISPEKLLPRHVHIFLMGDRKKIQEDLTQVLREQVNALINPE